MTRRYRAGLPALALLAAGCASPRPPSPDATLAEQQARCRNQMYESRRIVGRGPPNWNLYDQCMRSVRPRTEGPAPPTAQ